MQQKTEETSYGIKIWAHEKERKKEMFFFFESSFGQQQRAGTAAERSSKKKDFFDLPLAFSYSFLSVPILSLRENWGTTLVLYTHNTHLRRL